MDIFKSGLSLLKLRKTLHDLILTLEMPGYFLTDSHILLCAKTLQLSRVCLVEPLTTKVLLTPGRVAHILMQQACSAYAVIRLDTNGLPHHCAVDVLALILYENRHYSLLCVDLVGMQLSPGAPVPVYHYDSAPHVGHKGIAHTTLQRMHGALNLQTEQQIESISHLQTETNCGVAVLSVASELEIQLGKLRHPSDVAQRRACFEMLGDAVLRRDDIIAEVRTRFAQRLKLVQCALLMASDADCNVTLGNMHLSRDFGGLLNKGTLSTALTRGVFAAHFAFPATAGVNVAVSDDDVLLLLPSVQGAQVALCSTFPVQSPGKNISPWQVPCGLSNLQFAVLVLQWMRWKLVTVPGYAFTAETVCAHLAEMLIPQCTELAVNTRIGGLAAAHCCELAVKYGELMTSSDRVVCANAITVDLTFMRSLTSRIDTLENLLLDIGSRVSTITQMWSTLDLYTSALSDPKFIAAQGLLSSIIRDAYSDKNILCSVPVLLAGVAKIMMLYWPLMYVGLYHEYENRSGFERPGLFSISAPDTEERLTTQLRNVPSTRPRWVTFPVAVYRPKQWAMQRVRTALQNKVPMATPDEILRQALVMKTTLMDTDIFSEISNNKVVEETQYNPNVEFASIFAKEEAFTHSITDIVCVTEALQLTKKYGTVSYTRGTALITAPHPANSVMFAFGLDVRTLRANIAFLRKDFDRNTFTPDGNALRNVLKCFSVELPAIFLKE